MTANAESVIERTFRGNPFTQESNSSSSILLSELDDFLSLNLSDVLDLEQQRALLPTVARLAIGTLDETIGEAEKLSDRTIQRTIVKDFDEIMCGKRDIRISKHQLERAIEAVQHMERQLVHDIGELSDTYHRIRSRRVEYARFLPQ